MTSPRGDYVLGTHDVEVERLGLQHRVWRERVLGSWRRAGLVPGMRVADVGAGPGYATMDLADMVGPGGSVVAIERSPRFAAVLRARCAQRGLAHVQLIEGDLMDAAPLAEPVDLAWCRWVASFVSDVPRLVRWLAASVRPGGTVVMHEYGDYGSWRYGPPRPRLREFVAEVMQSWRDTGGEPDVGLQLVGLLPDAGFGVASVRAHVFTATPDDIAWQWPASFVASGAARLVELGRVTPDWAAAVEQELRDAEGDPASVVMTPVVWEIIARRR